jgi:3-deoxy-D-manno-octulosonic-acid transferase
MWGLYQAGMVLALALGGPVLLARRGRHYLATLPGRCGRHRGEAVQGALWLHAVSVGEVGVAATLARDLPAELPLLVTTVTPTGQARARAAFAGRGAVAYLPFDLAFAVDRFFARFHPRALVLVEGDYWPLVLATARRRGLPVAVVNGRVSDRGFGRMRRLRPLVRRLLGGVDRFGVQSDLDRERLLALGVPAERVVVTGNLKYETAEPRRDRALEARLSELAGGRPILVAGSTMAGEEGEVAAAFAALGGGERALLLLAPRHPERCGEVAALVAGRGFAVARRSALGGEGASGGEAAGGAAAGSGGRTDVLLLDTMGELAGLYAAAAAAFIGGTLVPTGGHNPLEPARLGVAVAAGPSMENFREVARRFDAAGAWRRVADAGELARVWGEWLADPVAAREQGARAAALVALNRGAAERTLELLGPILAEVQGAG